MSRLVIGGRGFALPQKRVGWEPGVRLGGRISYGLGVMVLWVAANILVYADDADAGHKQHRAQAITKDALAAAASGGGAFTIGGRHGVARAVAVVT